jgi:DNA-binding NtrC family response regulator
VPALDERREDIGALVAHFAGMQDRPLVFTAAAIHTLQNARWPGNVRQLRNLIDRLAVFAPESPITPAVIAEVTRTRRPCDADGAISRLAREILRSDEPEKLQQMEAALIDEALRLADDNKSQAARLLGVHRKAVERRLRARELDRAAARGGRSVDGLSRLIGRGNAAPAPLADDALIGA